MSFRTLFLIPLALIGLGAAQCNPERECNSRLETPARRAACRTGADTIYARIWRDLRGQLPSRGSVTSLCQEHCGNYAMEQFGCSTQDAALAGLCAQPSVEWEQVCTESCRARLLFELDHTPMPADAGVPAGV